VEKFTQILARYWGYSRFRPLQIEIIQSVYDGHDTLGLMPTGGGKSITFQLPAMAKDGLCISVLL
jgi:ATP-dependent DNA helicase RecQ